MKAKEKTARKRTLRSEPHPIGPRPIRLKRGSVEVKIYGTWNTSRRTDAKTNRSVSHRIPQYSLAYYNGLQRIVRKFSDLDRAKTEANAALVALCNGETEALKLSGTDRALYTQATEELNKLHDPPSLPQAISDYVAARSQLTQYGATLADVVRDYVEKHRSIREPRMIPALVEEFIETKQNAGKSEDYMNSLRRLRRFAQLFQMPVADINAPLLQSYFDGMKNSAGEPATPRTKLNYWRLVRALLRYAVRRRYASRDLLDELDAIELPSLRPTPTEIWSPDELREMFDACRPELIPWLAVAAFCGLRSAEIRRLDWADINLDRRVLTVSAQNAKTASRRIVPLCDAAVAWLTPHHRDSGPVAHFREENKFCSGITEAVKAAREQVGNRAPFKWRRNALRHSFCSYRLALTKDVAAVALEAGNSASMIFKHYRQLVGEDDASRWFNTCPPHSSSNVINLRTAS